MTLKYFTSLSPVAIVVVIVLSIVLSSPVLFSVGTRRSAFRHLFSRQIALCESVLSHLERTGAAFRLIFVKKKHRPVVALVIQQSTHVYTASIATVVRATAMDVIYSISGVFRISKRGAKFSLATTAHKKGGGGQTKFSKFFLW